MTQCQCLKANGQQCTREASKTLAHKNFCYQHQECKNMISNSMPIITPLTESKTTTTPLPIPIMPATESKMKISMKPTPLPMPITTPLNEGKMKISMKPTPLPIPIATPVTEGKTKLSMKPPSEVKSKLTSAQFNNTVITITFGDQAENHVGMQKIGKLAAHGFTVDDLKEAKQLFESKGCYCELIDLNSYLPEDIKGAPAAVLIARRGTDYLDDKYPNLADNMFLEQVNLNWDKKAKMFGKVVNKHVRYNLTYGETAQEPNYEEGKGRIIPFSEIPYTLAVRENLPNFLGPKASNLVAEGNKYHDISVCGIGWHGDSERKKVIAVRLGVGMELRYQWFHNKLPIGNQVQLMLNHGDFYVMSEKATGYDWRDKKKITLRHAAGCAKMLELPK